MDSNSTKLANLDATVSSIDGELGTVATQVDDIHTDVGTLDTDLTAVSGQVTTVNNNVLTVDAVVDSIKADTAAMIIDLGSLDTQLSIVDGNVDAIVAKLPSGMLSDLGLVTEIDGVTVEALLRKLMAMANGRYKLNVPNAGQITFYKRDNITPEFVVQVTDTERTRISG